MVQSVSLEISRLVPWIDWSFSRSSGPGGQNVNKVSTRVTLLFDFEACSLLDDAAKRRIRRRLSTRLSSDGRLRVVASRERTQARNRGAAEARLVELLEAALSRRKPRIATKPTGASKRRRIEEKKRTGLRKRERQSRPEIS